MRRQFLWVRCPGLYYLAPGNINFSQGAKGSLSFWYHPSTVLPTNGRIWRLEIDEHNSASLYWSSHAQGNLRFSVVSDGSGHTAQISDLNVTDYHHWWLVTATWDFSTPGAGELHLYMDDLTEDSTPTTANAPEGLPYKLYLGGRSGDATREFCADSLAIYDDVITREQHLARLGSSDTYLGRQNARRRGATVPGFSGNLLFHAGFDGGYNAQIASGDPTAYWEASEDEYDEFALIDDGSRYHGRKLVLPLGVPRHDGSGDDRIPGEAALEQFYRFGIGGCTSVENDPDCTRIVISDAPSSDYGEGRGWLWDWHTPGGLSAPMTLRMRVNMPPDTNPEKYWTCLGPLAYYNGGEHGGLFDSWGTGQRISVSDDADNTPSSFKVSLGGTADEWVGAELSVIDGNCAPARLVVVDFDPATQFITVDGALADVPEPGSLCLIDHRGRLSPYDNYGVKEKESMEAWLWENFGADKPWVELECQYDDTHTTPVVRYNRGRTTLMRFTTARCGEDARNGMMFGKNGTFGPNEGYSAEIRLESIEIDGPGNYQLLPASDGRYAKACAPRDNFMVRDTSTNSSTRIWRERGVTWNVQSPTKYPDPEQAQADLEEPGTWHESASIQAIVRPRTGADEVIALVRGTDPGGLTQLGYLVGTFDGERMHWQDETPPSGRENPFMKVGDLHSTERSDSEWGVEGTAGGMDIFGLSDGTWALLYRGSEMNPDHYQTRVLHGASDRWSFSYDEHFWPNNPVCPGIGGVGKLAPEWDGFQLWGNRDAPWSFLYNEHAEDDSQRFLGYARGKTILADGNIGTNVRPLMGLRSPDLKTFYPLPHGNMPTPLPSCRVHNYKGFTNGPDNICLLVEYLGGDLRLLASEDGIHFQQVTSHFIAGEELPGEDTDVRPGATFRMGDYRVYYYSAGFKNYASIKFDRETYYSLDGDETTGYIETPMIQQPDGGWEDLRVNVAPNGGEIRVEVIDPLDEQVIAGYSASDCDAMVDSIEHEVTWGGVRLSELTQDYLRLRFTFERPDSGAQSPELYAWEISPARETARPCAHNLQVEQQTDPVNVTDPEPELSWDYSDPDGLEQSAYHLLVASSQALLDENIGDLWDSGPVVSDATEVEYDGEALDELEIYFWKVRVRNAEGVWSEEW